MIAGGAVLLLLAIFVPQPPMLGVFVDLLTEAERQRRVRNLFWGGFAGAFTTLVGSILLLIPSGDYAWALGGVALAVWSVPAFVGI